MERRAVGVAVNPRGSPRRAGRVAEPSGRLLLTIHDATPVGVRCRPFRAGCRLSCNIRVYRFISHIVGVVYRYIIYKKRFSVFLITFVVSECRG